MISARATGLSGLTARRGRLVATLLAVALLFCHGAFGALHQFSLQSSEHSGGHHAPAAAPAAMDHQTEHQALAPPTSTDHQTGHQGGPLAHADYAAVLFVVLLGAALALFSVRSPVRSLTVAAHSPGRGLVPFSPRLPRGPTLPLLQVFRL